MRVKQRSLDVIALDRLLLYWATAQKLKKRHCIPDKGKCTCKGDREEHANGIAFTGYTGYRLVFNDALADYSEVYLYATEESLKEIKRRFEPNDRIPNVIVLKCDSDLETAIKRHRLKASSVCPAQLFADLWNINQWYAKDFVDALSKRLGI